MPSLLLPVATVRSRPNLIDIAACVLLLVGTSIYIFSLPHSLGAADEGFFLYEAKRILNGEVMYRDFFQFVTPVSWYIMALAFWIFGVDVATSQAVTSVVHGVTAMVTFVACRSLGVRPSISFTAALAYVAICPPAWPYASAHWFSTAMTALQLVVLLRCRWPWDRKTALLIGVTSGLLISLQQQKGTVFTVGIAILAVIDHLLERRFAAEPLGALARRLIAYAAGVAAVVIPLFAILLAQAGVQPIVHALLLFPLQNYRNAVSATWGSFTVLSRPFAVMTFPRLLKFSPLVLLLPALRAAYDWLLRRHRLEQRRLIILIVFSLTSMLSIMYFPDFIHIAFIVPVLLVVLAETVEWLLRPLARFGFAAEVGTWVLVAQMCIVLGLQTQRYFAYAHAKYPLEHDTAFGRVSFHNPKQILMVDALRRTLDDSPGRQLFCYPAFPSLYLLADGNNPTPYQMLLPMYRSTDQVDDLLEILETKKVRYLALVPVFVGRQNPLLSYINQHYEEVDDRLATMIQGGVLLMRRKTDTEPAAAAEGAIRLSSGSRRGKM